MLLNECKYGTRAGTRQTERRTEEQVGMIIVGRGWGGWKRNKIISKSIHSVYGVCKLSDVAAASAAADDDAVKKDLMLLWSSLYVDRSDDGDVKRKKFMNK